MDGVRNERSARARRATAAAVALLAAAVLLRGVAWTIALPAWQGPDEPAHFQYVERLADGRLPFLDRDRPARTSAALDASLAATAYEAYRFRTPARPLSQGATPPRERPGLSTASAGAGGATSYPPGYYALALPPYALPWLDTATERLYAVRLVSALLGAVLVLVTFALVREVTGDRLLALAGAAAVSFAPMVAQASATANPDILLAVATAGLGLALARARASGGSRRALAAVAGWAALALLAKPAGAALAAVLLAAFAAPALLGGSRRRALAAGVAAAVAVAAALALAAAARPEDARFALRHLRDFYAPGLPLDTVPAWRVWVESAVGRFGWLSAPLPSWTYVLALAVAVAAVALAVRGAAAARPDRRGVAVQLLAAVAAYVIVLHAVEIVVIVDGDPPILQGRYLVPVAPLLAAAALALVTGLPRRLAVASATALAAVSLLLGTVALDSVLRFYAG